MDLLIRVLLGILIIAVVLWLSRVALAGLPIDGTARGIILAIIAVLLLLVFLDLTGLVNLVQP